MSDYQKQIRKAIETEQQELHGLDGKEKYIRGKIAGLEMAFKIAKEQLKKMEELE